MGLITVSRGTCSGGKVLAECIANQLGYKCISREIIAEASERYGVSPEVLASSIDKAPKFLDRLNRDRDRYLAIIRTVLCEYALDGNLVYHGHAGHFLLAGPRHVLRIRVVANMEFRINAAMQRLGLTHEKAIEYIEHVDKERSRWTKFLYGVDWEDSIHYDAVFNLEHVSIPSACELICHMVQLQDFQCTEESQQALANLVLSNRIQAALLGDNRTASAKLEVIADKGEVTVRGSVKLQEAVEAIPEIIQTIEGITKVNYEIGLTSGFPF